MRNEPFLLKHFADAGIVRISDLIDTTHKSWFPSSYFVNKVNIHSKRILDLSVKVIHDAIPTKWKDTINTYLKNDNAYEPPPIATHLNFQLHASDELNLPLYKIEKGAIYKYIIMVLNFTRHSERLDTVWRDILGPPTDFKPNFRDCYASPITKFEGDLQWRILHGAYATSGFLASANFNVSDRCPLCGEFDSLSHTFLDCQEIGALCGLVKQIASGLVQTGVSFPPWWFVALPPHHCHRFLSHQCENLFLYVICLAKISIHISRRNKRDGNGSANPLENFKNRITSRIKSEHQYYKLINHLQNFQETWACNDVLCSLDNDTLQLHF